MESYWNGFFWGAGLLTSVLVFLPLVYLLATLLLRHKLRALSSSVNGFSESLKSLASSVPSYTTSSGLRVKEYRFEPGELGLRILGCIENSGNLTWEDIELTIDVFDEDEDLVDQHVEFVSAVIPPRETRNFAFDVTCDCLPSRVNVSIADAEPVSEAA